MRQIAQIECSCGGDARKVETTDKEERDYGCMRKGCCVEAMVCEKCHTRFTIVWEAPGME